MREMALDTLREVTYVCPIYSVRSNLTGMPFNLRENIRSITGLVDAKDDCITISAVHNRIDKESTERRKELERAHANLKGTPFSSLPSTPRAA